MRRGELRPVVADGEGAARSSPSPASAVVVAGLVAFYASVDPFDRAAGGEEVAFGAQPANQPSTTVAAAPDPDERRRWAPAIGSSSSATRRRTPWRSTCPTGSTTRSTSPTGRSRAAASTTRARCRPNATAPRCRSAAATAGRTSGPSRRRADADVALVVLGAWDVFDFELDDGTDLEFGTPEWDDYVTDDLQSGIDALVATGARVALLEVPCMRPQDVEGAGVPALPERGDDDRVAHLNDLWRQVADANPGTVTFVPGPKEWCDDETVASDLAYRWDGVHVYTPGANLIYTTIAPTLLAL